MEGTAREKWQSYRAHKVASAPDAKSTKSEVRRAGIKCKFNIEKDEER